MTTRSPVIGRVLQVVAAAVALTIIAVAASPRLALVAALSAGAVCATRLRFSTVGAAALLAAVASLSIAAPRAGTHDQSSVNVPASRGSLQLSRTETR
jgi:hypothetical protein